MKKMPFTTKRVMNQINEISEFPAIVTLSITNYDPYGSQNLYTLGVCQDKKQVYNRLRQFLADKDIRHELDFMDDKESDWWWWLRGTPANKIGSLAQIWH